MITADTKPSSEEMMGSLTGFEEIAIAEHFGADWTDLSPTMTSRSLVFVLLTRDGRVHREAKQEVMGMRLDVVRAHFADDEDDVMPDEPDSPAGKDD